MLEVENLLAPVGPDAPSGASLEYDPAFISLFEAAKGRPEQQMGSSVIPAQPPDWRNVEKSSLTVFGRTKDLRVAILLVRARIQTAGAVGMFEGLAFVRALLERHWDTLHPQLDPDDDNDPAMRMNALAELANAETTVAAFRNAELASARAVGRIRVRDLERREGPAPAAAPAEGAEAPAEEKPVSVDAVLAACDPAVVQKTSEAASAAVEDLRALEAFVREKVGAERAPNLSRLAELLQLVAKTLAARIAGPAAADGAGAAADGTGDGAPGNGAAGPGLSGTVRSRQDVVAALDGICAYYERFEPSSPLPLLLRRAKRLVAGSFEDIVKDLLPEAAGTVETLRGKGE